jgi:hypothetical protein
MLTLTASGCAYVQQWQVKVQSEVQPSWPAKLTCRGDFAQFSNGFMITRPMELTFAVWWTVPAVQPLDGGSPARILSLTSLELSFEVKYEGYKAAYHLNRVDGSFTQRPNIGGVFSGTCDVRPLTPQM